MKSIFWKLIFWKLIFKKYMNFIMIYPFYMKEWKLKRSKKLEANLHDKTEYVVNIRNLKHALNQELNGLALKIVLRVIRFDQNAWLKPYIDKNTFQKTKAKKWFWKGFFKLMNNAVFGKKYGKCEKTGTYFTYHKRKKKKLFGVIVQIFHKKIISNRNKNKWDS